MANYENIKPYAEFAHVAAQHGGVHEYMNQIAEYNYSLGAMQGASDAYMTSFVVGGICMVISAGFYFYNKRDSSGKSRKMQIAGWRLNFLLPLTILTCRMRTNNSLNYMDSNERPGSHQLSGFSFLIHWR